LRIAASNIAWDPEEDSAIAALLTKYSIDAVDVAPAKYFPDPGRATASEIAAVRTHWADRGIAITGMQALLFGSSGLNVFGNQETRRALLERLNAVCRIGEGLHAPRLVFGSPKNRDRSHCDDATTHAIAVDFFGELGAIAEKHGVWICLEPNPARYGANFMINSAQTADIVAAVAHPAIKMQLDTGAVTINQEDVRQVIDQFGARIGHVHASEPDLVPLGDGDTDHALIGNLLRRDLPEQVVTIEMVATKNEPHLTSVERAVRVATRHYGAAAGEPS
jgi:D-psicose/D-tagatose/L-ribulose 3-epimerase